MNKFINKILKETEEDDSFFQPKNLSNRDEEIKGRRDEVLHKIKLGLQNIKSAYKNKDWDSEKERMFLQIFFKFNLHKNIREVYDVFFLVNENDKVRCIFNLQSYKFSISDKYIWEKFERKFHLEFYKIQSFMKNMLKKYFKMDEFIPELI